MDHLSCAVPAPDALESLEFRAPSLQILASTELRLALRAWMARTTATPVPAQIVFDTALHLNERLRAGEPVDVAVLSQIELAQALLPDGEAALPIGRDRLVLAARPDLRLAHGDLLDRLQTPTLRLGSALPEAGDGSDPANQFFDRIEQAQQGAAAAVRSRARPLTLRGEPPSHRQVMEMLVSGQMDVVIGLYSDLRTLSHVADLVTPGGSLAVEITAGAAVLASGGPRRKAAECFVACLRAPAGQALLKRHGFDPVLPTL